MLWYINVLMTLLMGLNLLIFCHRVETLSDNWIRTRTTRFPSNHVDHIAVITKAIIEQTFLLTWTVLVD